MVMLTVLVVVVIVLMLMIMVLTMMIMAMMIMIVTMVVVIMRMIVAAATIRAMYVLGGRARRTTRLTPGNRLRHQTIFFRLRIDVMVMIMVVVVAMRVVIVVMPVMLMVMMVVIMMSMITRMPVIVMIVAAHAAKAIGTALGLERRGDEADLRAELLDQFDEHIVVADAERIGQKLRRRMAIAEMPRDARDDVRIGRAEFNKALRLAGHDDDIARLQLEAVAIDERRRFGEIDQEFAALGARQRATATAAIVEIEFNRVDHAARIKAAVGEGLGRSDHGGHVSNGLKARTVEVSRTRREMRIEQLFKAERTIGRKCVAGKPRFFAKCLGSCLIDGGETGCRKMPEARRGLKPAEEPRPLSRHHPDCRERAMLRSELPLEETPENNLEPPLDITLFARPDFADEISKCRHIDHRPVVPPERVHLSV